MAKAAGISVGMIVFPGMTNLDFAGPFEIFAKLPDARVEILWKDTAAIQSDAGLHLTPTTSFALAPALDLLFVPGGPGQVALMDDADTLNFIASRGRSAKWVTSVCTGALLLGAAGLLRGYRAATHWSAMDQLGLFGAIPTNQRVVIDRNRVTGGGVTAGIDFGLTLAAIIAGDDYARRVQLGLEYAPEPPFDCGTPDRAPPALVDLVRKNGAERAAIRRAASERAARRLGGLGPSPGWEEQQA
jgi:cyclohexyl-isocyanide hydratase